ncbi:hypothetical protein HY624_04355 [Candidatus Uhrbacteria bacterium]|nr:hypothetical protein [Candidatus Uhrbacteria bacterium]
MHYNLTRRQKMFFLLYPLIHVVLIIVVSFISLLVVPDQFFSDARSPQEVGRMAMPFNAILWFLSLPMEFVNRFFPIDVGRANIFSMFGFALFPGIVYSIFLFIIFFVWKQWIGARSK